MIIMIISIVSILRMLKVLVGLCCVIEKLKCTRPLLFKGTRNTVPCSAKGMVGSGNPG